MRAELSPDEEREHLRRRKDLWERQKAAAEAKAMNNGAPCATNRGRGRPKSFAAESAAAIGKSKSQINRRLAESKAKAEGKKPRKRRAKAQIEGFERFVNMLEALVESNASD